MAGAGEGLGARRPARLGGEGASSTSRRRVAVRAIALLVAGAVALSSALSPWWYTRTTSAGTSSLAEFFPGQTIYAGGGGGGGTTTYGASGLDQVGALYLGVLVAALFTAALSWASATEGILELARRPRPRRRQRQARWAAFACLAVSVSLLAGVPLAQPVLYRSDDPGGSCGAGLPAGPCSSFWGSTQALGVSRVWGAAAGWWAELAVAILTGLALSLWRLPRPAGDEAARVGGRGARP